MPIFVLKCSKCEGVIKEVITCYDKVHQYKCDICGSDMVIVPSKGSFKVNGYNAENGYHRETIDYAKGVIG